MTAITRVFGREILDSRGNPTVQVDVTLEDGSLGRASVPSGASTGTNEAVELRDGDPARFHGKGVLKAVGAVNGEIAEAVMGLNAQDQALIDETLIELDGTKNKGRLGANATLGVSLAVAHAGAIADSVPLYRHVGGVSARLMPVPLMNIINGGAHADNPIDFQEFMIAPVGAPTFSDAVRMGSEVFHTLRKSLKDAGHNVNVGDEGGFGPNLRSAEEALTFVTKSIEDSGYEPGTEIGIAIDPAASEFFRGGIYDYAGEGVKRTVEEHVQYVADLVGRFPIISLEDPTAEDDFDGWKLITETLGSDVQLVCDDIYCTDVVRLLDGIRRGFGNSILVKPNQIGTLTETLITIETAQKAAYTVVVSHRSGETEDTTVADIAVGSRSGQIKTGSLSRSDRNAKYNRLMLIEEELGSQAVYAGRSALSAPGRYATL